MSDTQLHELCKGFGALLSRSKVRDQNQKMTVQRPGANNALCLRRNDDNEPYRTKTYL